jgi:hypothetical protein
MKFNTQNWSAPKKMTVFILICMILVFSFESLGLTNKEGNLDIRKASVILVQTAGNLIDSAPQTEKPLEQVVEKLVTMTQKQIEEKKGKMFQMLIEGASPTEAKNDIHSELENIDTFYDI